MSIEYEQFHIKSFSDSGELEQALKNQRKHIEDVQQGAIWNDGRLGWFCVDQAFPADERERLRTAASWAQETAQVLVVIGIGGSNRGALAAISALHRTLRSPTRVLFAGDTLSASSLLDTLELIKNESVILNVIAKDFNTVEPGIAFRLLRKAMKEKYGHEYNKRIVVTGSHGKGQLQEMAEKEGYRFLAFPKDVGGRFSVLTTVALFPMAVAGLDIDTLLEGAKDMERQLKETTIDTNPAVQYAVNRNILFLKGFHIESLVFFEPDLIHLARWWVQLFAESEGKNQKAIFPTFFSYSEDLHAVGQYVQEGKRNIQETYLCLFHENPNLIIGPSTEEQDGFDYLDGKAFDKLNRSVYQAAFKAHSEAGVPCTEIAVSQVTERNLGQVFYFFMFAVYVSASLLGVDPFSQDGVENYKDAMYSLLGKNT
ncbi:glucose-6-phosphate isomerase [Treponema sp.]